MKKKIFMDEIDSIHWKKNQARGGIKNEKYINNYFYLVLGIHYWVAKIIYQNKRVYKSIVFSWAECQSMSKHI